MKIFEYFWVCIILFKQYSQAEIDVGQTLQLLDDQDPYQKLTASVLNTRIGLGFWFKFNALKKLSSTHIINEIYDQNIEVKGQLIFHSLGDQQKIVLYFMKDFDNNMINLKFMIDSNYEYIFNYEFYNFEGKWIFTFIVLDSIQNQVEIYLFNQYSLDNLLYKQFQLSTQIPQIVTNYLGGYGKISNFNLLPFTAKYSEFLVINDFEKIGYNYELFYKKIIQPIKFEILEPQAQKITLIGDQYFNGYQVLDKTIYMEGSTFQVQGWVKLNEEVEDYGFVLLDIQFTQQKYLQYYPGSQILQIQYQLTPQIPINCNFGITQQFNQNPNFDEPYIYSGQEITFYYGLPYIYSQLINWHYIWYQSGNENQPASIYVFFSYNQMVIGKTYFIWFQPYQFSNVNARIQIAGNQFQYTFLNGWISKLEFIHSYKSNQYFELNCHPTCNNCLGPYENQCLSCNPLYNRYFLVLKNMCVCQIGYVELPDRLTCVLFEQIYSKSIVVKQKFDEDDDINCYLGYFKFMSSCYPCPFGNEILNCLDCINNQDDWYENPICNWDFEQNLNSFRYTERKEEYLDLYLINQPFSIQLCIGCAQFCSDTDSECYELVGVFHLGKQVRIQCKSTFKFIDGACKQRPLFCQIQSSNGLCIKCESGYYQDLSQYNCIECPIDCLECHYDNIGNSIVCDSCQNKNFAIFNGVCTRCGLNCKVCQPDFNFQKQEPFLRCLECIDMSQYYIMFNAVDCLENSILYCQYAFQYLDYDHSITTLDIINLQMNFNLNQSSKQKYYYKGFQKNMYILSILSQIILIQIIKIIKLKILISQIIYILNLEIMIKMLKLDVQDVQMIYTLTLLLLNNVITHLIQDKCKYICLIIYNQIQPSQTIYQQHYYCPLIDSCVSCLKINENNQMCLICKAGYYASFTGVCIKCPTSLNCFMCEQNLKLFNNNYRNEIRAFYKYFVEGSSQSHFFNDYNLIFVQEDYTVQCVRCLESQELYNGKCIASCPKDCQSCIKINDQNVCQSCPYTYLGQSLTVYNDSCLECPTYCSICIKRSQSSVQAINPYYLSSASIYQNICIRGYSQLFYYDQDLQSYQDCSKHPDQLRCFRSITLNVKIYCQDDYTTNENYINLKDLFSQNQENNHLSYFENSNLYSYANKNTVKEIIYDFEIVDGNQNSCIIPQNGFFEQSTSKYVFSAILIKLNLYSKQQTDLQINENYRLLGFTEIVISNITFIQSSSAIATITIESLFKLATIFQSVNFGNLKKQQEFQINAQNQIFMEFRDTQFLNVILSQINSQLILITTTDPLSKFVISNTNFINCNFTNIILFNIFNDNSLQISILNLKITNNIIKNSTYIQLSNIKTDNQILIQKLNLKLYLFDCNPFFNLTYFSKTQVNQLQLLDTTLTNTTFFTLSNIAELEEIIFSQVNLLSSSTFFISGIQSIQNIQFLLNKILFDSIKYDSQNPFIYIYQSDNQTIQLELSDIQVQKSTLTKIELFNGINIWRNKIVLSCNSVMIKNFIILREEDLPEITILNSKEINIENLQIIQQERTQLQSFMCLNDSKFHQEFSLITFFEVTSINIQNSNFSNLTLYNQGIFQILYDQQKTLFQEIQQKTVIFHQIKFLRNLILKNLNKDSLGFISLIHQNYISIKFTYLQCQGNLLNEFLEEAQISSSLLITVIAPRGLFSIMNSQLEYNIILNSTFSLLYINTQELNISSTIFNNNNVINYTTLYYFVKDLQFSIASIYSQSGNGYLKTTNLIINDVQLNTSLGFYGGGFQISSQNISTILIENCKFNNLSNIGNSLSFGAALYLEIQSQEIILKFINISVIQVFTQNLGGFLFIKSSIYQKIKIEFYNSFFKDNFAKSGSLLYFDNSINSNQQICKLSLTQIIVEQSKQNLYFENLKFESQNKINDIFLLQRELINIKMCSLELNSSLFSNLVQEGIVKIEDSSDVVLVNLQVDNSQIAYQYLFNILSYQDIMLVNVLIRNTQIFTTHKSIKNICKSQSLGSFDCIALYQDEQKISQQICILTDLLFSSKSDESILIFILQQTTDKVVFLRNITFMSNQANQLINIQSLVKEANSSQIIVDTILSNKNLCQDSCISIKSINSQLDFKVSKQIFISNYYCIANSAKQGGCLQIYQFPIHLSNSIFLNNTASQKGGAIFYEGNNLSLKTSQIYYNKAEQGGGIFTNIQLPIFIEEETFKANSASYFGNDFVEIPSKLAIIVDNFKNILYPKELQKNGTFQLDQIEVFNYTMFDGTLTNYIYFPSGQQINKYQYFDQKQNKFIDANLTLRVVALNRQNDIMKNLSNSQCIIYSDDNSIFLKSKFNELSQDFTFDDQTFRFTPYTEQVLKLNVKCDCVQVLSDVKANQYEYQLQFKIKTFICKIGEIFDQDQCKVCDYSQDLYSVTIKSIKCSKRNELTTSQVTSGQLKLRQGFWRFNQNSDIILQCSYSQTKCQGGWETGDDSCEAGYVGALCEQCDIYGTKGSEKFQNLFKYSCEKCSSQRYTIFYYIILNIWNILAIVITAVCIKVDFNKLFKFFWFSTVSCNKLFLHYFQIIFYLTVLQLNIPMQLSSIINFFGNPTESISFSLDCVLANYETKFNIIYIRAIIQIFSPIIYLIIICVFVLLIFRIDKETQKHIVYNSLQYCKLYYSPSIFSCLISLISYREIGGQKWILADVTYLFDSREHFLSIVQFILPIFVIFIIILILDFVSIFQKKHQLTLLKTKMMFGYLYLNYKSTYYYWEYCKLVQKFLLVIVFLQFQDQLVWKATFVVFIITVYQQLVQILQPYKALIFNKLECQMQIVCLTTIIFSILIVQSQKYNIQFIEISCYVFLIIINTQFLFNLCKLVLKVNSFQGKQCLDKISHNILSICPQLKQYKICSFLIQKRAKDSISIRKKFQKFVNQMIYLMKYKDSTTKQQENGNRISLQYYQQDFDTQKQFTITNTDLPQMSANLKILKTNTEFNQDDYRLGILAFKKQGDQPNFRI